jgi:hypothetical protein
MIQRPAPRMPSCACVAHGEVQGLKGAHLRRTREGQLLADPLGDEWGGLGAYIKIPKDFASEGTAQRWCFIQWGARQGLTRRRAAQLRRGYLLLVQGEVSSGVLAAARSYTRSSYMRH